ncbi:uncharacterized protein B0H18DRAFT_883793 [Fomitopsis serialis]|uniref:uncharacterized protein n=1 Tax=Fomitopsis serialis TaxID=139415 RepID=UPI0020082419|nr:uncharacterized protein B0H18DRAFT_883793 [Neoantrodia serialis]KAH9917474.1 hypothetical protein B0H18DRAFT_883793 [Neoantrodia serialis]
MPEDTTPAANHPQGETLAALKAVLDAPWDAPLHIVSSSAQLAEGMTQKLPLWEDRGWIEVDGATYTRALVNQLRQRCAITTFRTPRSGGEKDTMLAARDHAVASYVQSPPQHVPPRVTKSFDLSGAKMSTLTQALAYRGIRASATATERRTTNKHLSEIRACLAPRKGPVQDGEIWSEIRHADIRRVITDFLWKSIHGAYRIGSYWKNIPGYEERAKCRLCGVTESMAHILTECAALERWLIWGYVERAWTRTGRAWSMPSWPSILAAGQATPARTNGKPPRDNAVRLWRILLTEAAYLIWCMRCERVIRHEDEAAWQHDERSVAGRWYLSTNRRLRLDIESTHSRFGRLALKRQIVLDTWHQLVWDVQALPDDWTSVRWVLVGIDPTIVNNAGPGS